MAITDLDKGKAVSATSGRDKGRVVSVTSDRISATVPVVTGGLAKVKPISEISDLTSATDPAVVGAVISDREATPLTRAMAARRVTFPSEDKPVSEIAAPANLHARPEAAEDEVAVAGGVVAADAGARSRRQI